MSVNIYDELELLRAAIAQVTADQAATATKLAVLEAKLVPRLRTAPVSYFRADKLLPDGSLAWDAVIAAKPALAMINPGSGPGPSKSTSYAALVVKAQAAGVPVFGYVHTKGTATATNPSGYGERPASEVKADILNHIAWHGVTGIFIDCTSNKPEHVPYYTDLCAFVHSKGCKVVLNPGTQCLEDHAKMADYVMCSEGTLATYKARVARAWEANYPGKLWHCVHTCPDAEMPATVALAKARGAGLLYVTSAVMPNPYGALSPYWAGLCTEVARV